MKKTYNFITENIYRPFLLLYLKKQRTFNYKGLTLKINPGVFHPAFFYSSKIFADFIETLCLKNKNILDLGTGSGILALIAAKAGGNSTASDISELSIQNAKINAELNNLEISIIKSDLFAEIKQQLFDYIFINPPYYSNNPQAEQDYAWYCGNEFQYYSKLFKQYSDYINIDSRVFMILSDDCDLNSIENIADQFGLKFNMLLHKKKFFEKFFVFEIKT